MIGQTKQLGGEATEETDVEFLVVEIDLSSGTMTVVDTADDSEEAQEKVEELVREDGAGESHTYGFVSTDSW